jgi:ribosomal protein S18 acetylase RimI-like enzyme
MKQDVQIIRKPHLTDDDLNHLFVASWPGHTSRSFAEVLKRSLAYFGAYQQVRLIGFVNLAWDGGVHAFLLDPTVHPDFRRQGIGLALVNAAARLAADGGIEWLHVDYEPELESFYRAAGFRSTLAGLLRVAS